jgi:hypothetical protein
MPDATIPANAVTEVASAPSADAAAHFTALLSVETDCYDVNQALKRSQPGFVLLDVRSPEAYATGHVPHAIHFPHRRMTEATLAHYPPDTLFVVYCAGPHCNGADREDDRRGHGVEGRGIRAGHRLMRHGQELRDLD